MSETTDFKLVGACTIVSPNYLAYARTLAASYRANHPQHQFFVLIVANLPLSDRVVFEGEGFTPIMLAEIGLAQTAIEGMKYDILELNTNVKPTFMKYLLGTFALSLLVYLDPDVYVYAPLTPVFEALDEANAVLIPHVTTPLDDGKQPSEQDYLYNGTYNLGFFAIRRGEETDKLLNWWERRCLDYGYSEGRTGLFVDQKWMNLAPGLFEGVVILRHAGCNVAYWNLHERWLSLNGSREYFVNGETRLLFFHFSGIVVSDPSVLSKNTNRFTLADRPDLQDLFFAYKQRVIGFQNPVTDALPYGFDTFTDGTVVTRLARRIYAIDHVRWNTMNPFDSGSDFAQFARRKRLVAGKVAAPKSTWKEFNLTDRRVATVHFALKAALRLLGPNRYELLMRYLSYISVLRNQKFLSSE